MEAARSILDTGSIRDFEAFFLLSHTPSCLIIYVIGTFTWLTFMSFVMRLDLFDFGEVGELFVLVTSSVL